MIEALSDVEVLRPTSDNTRVSYTNVTKENLKLVLVLQDIPMILTQHQVYRHSTRWWSGDVVSTFVV